MLPGPSASPAPAWTAIRAVSGQQAQLLTVRDVASRLGVCAATVYRLCAEGALVHLRVSNAIRVALGDLEAFLAARRKGRAE